jgi:peptidoglycan/LPS O-acetylase OafA/YrhL
LIPGQRYPALDGLRAVAVGLVMVGHYTHRTEIGTLGVGIFYVLSGFLITGLLLTDYRRSGAIHLSAFYARRAIRIMPAYYVFLAVAFVVLSRTASMPPTGTWWASGVYVNDFWSAFHYRPSTQLTHTWSLGVEEKFYLAWPLLLLVRIRKGRSVVLRSLAMTIVAVILWRLVLLAFAGLPLHRLAHYLQFAFEARLDYLSLGCALALLQSTGTWDRIQAAAAVRRSLPLVPITALGIVTLTFGRWRWWAISQSIEAVLIAGMLVLLLAARWQWLDHPIARYLGALSYSIYLYHMLAWFVAGELVLGEFARALLAAVVTLPLAAASYHLVERPFLRWRDRHLQTDRGALHDVRSSKRPRVRVV